VHASGDLVGREGHALSAGEAVIAVSSAGKAETAWFFLA
jgi:hypothetical protein